MKNKNQDGYLAMAGKAIEGTSVGQALKGGMRAMGAMKGCSAENPMSEMNEVEVPAGTKMCFISGAIKTPVITKQDIMEGQQMTVVELPNGKLTNVDVESLVDDYECREERVR